MGTKKRLQDKLSEEYGINKNITAALSQEECANLLLILQNEPSVLSLVASFSSKNRELGRNNSRYGTQRSQAEKKLAKIQAENQALQQSIQDGLDKEPRELQARLQALETRNQQLIGTLQTLESSNQNLSEANAELQKDNKALKNLVDKLKLRLALDLKQLMKYEDSELRKAAARIFRWTQE